MHLLVAATKAVTFAATVLTLYPETATSLGVDKDARAQLKHQLADRSPSGQARIAAHLRGWLASRQRLVATSCAKARRF